MLRKICFSLTAVFIVSVIVGCAPPTRKDNTFRSRTLYPKSKHVETMTADLEVSDKKVMGEAAGKTKDKAELEKIAIAEALKPTTPSESRADVLVASNFFYKYNGSDLTVTVVGYPARYRNFEPKNAKKVDDGKIVPSSPAPLPQPVSVTPEVPAAEPLTESSQEEVE